MTTTDMVWWTWLIGGALVTAPAALMGLTVWVLDHPVDGSGVIPLVVGAGLVALGIAAVRTVRYLYGAVFLGAFGFLVALPSLVPEIAFLSLTRIHTHRWAR